MSDARSPLILVADDDEEILDLIAFRLRKAGYRTLTARDGLVDVRRNVARGQVDRPELARHQHRRRVLRHPARRARRGELVVPRLHPHAPRLDRLEERRELVERHVARVLVDHRVEQRALGPRRREDRLRRAEARDLAAGRGERAVPVAVGGDLDRFEAQARTSGSSRSSANLPFASLVPASG